MTYRRTLKHRPWLTGAAYDKYCTPNTLHYDLYAWVSETGTWYFEAHASTAGKTPLAYSLWRYEPLFGLLALAPDARPADLKAVRWRRRTRDVFNRVHGVLLGYCVTPAGYTRVSVHAHYCGVPDPDPWPRGWVNYWEPLKYADGRAPGKSPAHNPGATGATNTKTLDLPDVL